MCFSWFKVFLLVFNCRWASWHVHGGGARESAEPRWPTAAGEQRQTADHVQGVDPVQVPQSAGTAARDTGLRSRTETRQSDADRDPVWPELHPQPKLLVLAFGIEQLCQDSDEEDARTLLCASKNSLSLSHPPHFLMNFLYGKLSWRGCNLCFDRVLMCSVIRRRAKTFPLSRMLFFFNDPHISNKIMACFLKTCRGFFFYYMQNK